MKQLFCRGTLCDAAAVVIAWMYIIFGEAINVMTDAYFYFVGNLETYIGIATLVLVVLRIRKIIKGD